MAKSSDDSDDPEKYIIQHRKENQGAGYQIFNHQEHQLIENKEEFRVMAQEALDTLGLTKNSYRKTIANKEKLAEAIGDSIAYSVQKNYPEFSATDLVQMARGKITNRIVLALNNANAETLNDKVGYAAYEKAATKSGPDQSLIKAKKPSLLKTWRKAAVALLSTGVSKKTAEGEYIPVRKNLIDSRLTEEMADEARRMANLLNWQYEEGSIREFSVNQEVRHQIILHQIAASAIAIVSKKLDEQINSAGNEAYMGELEKVKQNFDSKRNRFMKRTVMENSAYAAERALNFGSEHLDQNFSMTHQELLINDRVAEMERQLLQSIHKMSASSIKPLPLPPKPRIWGMPRPSSATQLSSDSSATPTLTPSPSSSSSVLDTIQLPQSKPSAQSYHHRNNSEPAPSLSTLKPSGFRR